MPALGFKNNMETELTRHVPPAVTHQEIDLLGSLNLLLAAKKRIITIVLAFAVAGVVISFLLPQKWTSKAVVTPADQTQWAALRQMLVEFKVLNVDVNVTRADTFNLFIKKFQSRSLLEDYMTSSSYVMDQLKDAKVDPLELHRAVVNIAAKMKASDDTLSKGEEKVPYTSWTLSFTAPTAQDAQVVLEGYINYISGIVKQETLQNIRNALDLKIRIEKESLELDRVHLINIHNTNLRRLNYSLEVANAAGIKKPVYSNGQAVKDDPDYSVALGADGIAQKLQIEKSLKDVTEMNADLQNREYQLAKLEKLSLKDVELAPVQYQLSPSLPITRDGPGRSLIVLLAALVGGLIACGSVLLREAMLSRPSLPEPVTQ